MQIYKIAQEVFPYCAQLKKDAFSEWKDIPDTYTSATTAKQARLMVMKRDKAMAQKIRRWEDEMNNISGAYKCEIRWVRKPPRQYPEKTEKVEEPKKKEQSAQMDFFDKL